MLDITFHLKKLYPGAIKKWNMEPGKFTGEIRERLIVDALQTYVELFTNTQISEATDPHWVEALNFFQALDEKKQNQFFSILRQISVDTVSEFLSILDGITLLNGQNSEFVLKEKGDEKIINGDLQDLFLQLEGI